MGVSFEEIKPISSKKLELIERKIKFNTGSTDKKNENLALDDLILLDNSDDVEVILKKLNSGEKITNDEEVKLKTYYNNMLDY